MKIAMTGIDNDSIGGGFTFCSNIQKGLKDKVEFVRNIRIADLYFITSCTLINRDDVDLAVRLGVPIVFRVDNLPKQSNNRGTAFTNLKICGENASYIVYQSNWAKEYVSWFVRNDKAKISVILNGVDTSVFNSNGRVNKKTEDSYLFIGRKGEENKRYGEAFYTFHMKHRENKNAFLRIIGTIPSKVAEYNMDFVDGESFQFLGQVLPQQMPEMYKATDVLLAPYYNDACSNAIIEARMSGCRVDAGTGANTGGTREILMADEFELTLDYMSNKYMEVFSDAIK